MYYRSLNSYLREQYGEKVYKLSLSAGCTCPNRDGTIGTRGCIFCNGSGDFATSAQKPISQQLLDAKSLIREKTNAQKFIAYFQDYTNTYASVSYLEPLFREAITDSQVVILSVATRPDCLPDATLSMLERLSKIKPVWVELGLQTIHEDTARYIRRGYPLSCYEEAVRNLHAIGAAVITHQIIGLPGETPEQMVETSRYIGRTGSDGIKLHLLHVLEHTDLAEDYRQGRFETLSLQQYIDILERCIEVLPPEMVIHRLTGDGAKRNLIAPLWSGNKKLVLNTIAKTFREHELVQGSRL